MTNKLLLEAGVSYAMNRWPYPEPGRRTSCASSPDDISILEQSTGFRYNAKAYLHRYQDDEPTASQRFSLSYVTGSHAFKTGIQLEQGINNECIGIRPTAMCTTRS